MPQKPPKPTVQWDLDGRFLLSAEASLFMQATTADWRRIANDCGLEFHEPQSTSHPWSAHFSALAKENKPLDLYLTGQLHPTRANHELMHLWLRLHRAPDSAPPPSLAQSSERVGGYPQVLANIATHWPAEAPCKAAVSASFGLNPKHWRPARRRASALRSHTKPSAPILRQQLVKWTAEAGTGPLRSVSYSYPDSKGLWVLLLEGDLSVPIQVDYFSQLVDGLWQAAVPYLTQREQ